MTSYQEKCANRCSFPSPIFIRKETLSPVQLVLTGLYKCVFALTTYPFLLGFDGPIPRYKTELMVAYIVKLLLNGFSVYRPRGRFSLVVAM